MVSEFFFFILILNSFSKFLNWIQKYLHFEIIVYSSGVMYSMDNIEISNILSIKQIFELFPCSYFKSQGNTNNRKFIPIEFFLKFRWTGSYQSYIWTMRNRGTLFFIPPLFTFFKSVFLFVIKRIYTFYRKQDRHSSCLRRYYNNKILPLL